MIKLFIALALFLSGCTTVVEKPVPVAAPPAKSKYVEELEKFRAEVAERKQAAPGVDLTMQNHLNCRYLFAPGSDGMTNCLMRGMDRHVPPYDGHYVRRDDEISIRVPKPQPRQDPGVPAYPVAPGAAYVNPNALVDCRLDPTYPCNYPVTPQDPWGNPYNPGQNR